MTSILDATPDSLLVSNDDSKWLWFDVDDVLVGSTPLFQQSLDKWSGTTVPWQTWTHNHFHKFYGVADSDTETLLMLRELWQKDRVLERSPLLPDVLPVLNALREKDFSIGLLTARAWHPEGVEITQAMADQHKLPVSKIISMDYFGTKADFLKQTGTRVEGFLDDTIRHVEGCVAAGFNSALMDQPWNAQATHLPRIKRLADYPAWIEQAIAAKEALAQEPALSVAPMRRRGPGA